MGPKFILKEDMIIKLEIANSKKEIKLLDMGTTFEANENGEYIIETIAGKTILREDGMRVLKDISNSKLLFDVIEEEKEAENQQEVEIVIEEIPDDDDEHSKRWRIQLDVTTTRKKLKEIERFINENIKKLL